MIRFFLISLILIISLIGNVRANKVIFVGTESVYPPFEFKEKGVLVGFDIDLVNEIAKELGVKVEWVDMQFSSLLTSLNTGKVDVIAAAVTITEERAKSFDFSVPYGYETIVLISMSSSSLLTESSLEGKKVCVQLGSTSEIWAKANLDKSKLVSFDTTNQCVEAVKAGQLDALLTDGAQASVFVEKNSKLSESVFVRSKDGYGFAFKKGSKLKNEFNFAIKNIQEDGRMDKIKQKWNVQF